MMTNVEASARPGRTRLRLAVLLVSALFALWFGFFHFAAQPASMLVRVGGFYVITATVALWLGYLVLAAREARFRARMVWTPELRLALLVALGLTLVAVCTASYRYKVLFDETVIQATALNLATDKAVGAIKKAYELNGQLYVLSDYLDKRPYLFPYLVAVLHHLTGAREANAFALNTGLMPVVLLLAYGCGRRLAGPAAGMVAMISLGAFSLLALNATGAGLEMLNLALVLATVYCGGRYLEKPGDARLGLLVLTAVLLANTRYESSMYVVTTGLVVLEGWRRAGRAILPAAALLAPLLLLPYALHNTYLSGTPALWELREGQQHRFSFDYFTENAISAGHYFVSLGNNVANSPWLTWAGLAAFAGWTWRTFRRRLRWSEVAPMEWSAAAVGLGVVVNLGLLLSYYWGNLSDLIVTRLSLPFHAMLALLIGCAVAWLASRVPRAVPIAITVCLCSYLWWGLPMNRKIGPFNLIETTQRWELAVVEQRGLKARLIVTEKSPFFWFIRGMSATSINVLRNRLPELRYHWERKSFDEILVMQRLSPINMTGDYEIEKGSRLPSEIELETIEETRIGVKRQRISRVRAVRAEVEDPVPAREGESSP